MSESTATYTPEQALQQGIRHHQAGQLQEAERFYRALLEVAPRHPDANHNLGVLALGRKQLETALPLLETAVDVNPAFAQYWLSYLEALIVAGKLKPARTVLAAAVRNRVPARALAPFKARLKAAVRAQPGMLLAQPPSRPSQVDEDHFRALFDQGRYAELESVLRTVIKDFPGYGFAWKVMAALLQRQSRFGEAVPFALRAVELLPDDPHAHSNLGVILREQGRLEESESSCRKAIALYQGSASLYVNLAASLLALRRHEEALACAEKALEIEPRHGNGLVNCGNALWRLGRLDEAIACYRRALEDHPDLFLALNNLGAALCQKGLAMHAEEYLRRSLAVSPDDPDALKNLGNVLLKLCRVPEALACLNRASAVDPSALTTRLQAALLLPPLADSRQDIACWRERFKDGIAALLAQPFQLSALQVENCTPVTFELAYHDADDRPLLEALCRLYRSKAPVLNHTAPHITDWHPPTHRKIRIGFCSEFIVGHTIGKLYQGLLRHLDRARFEVILLHAPHAKRDNFSAMLDALVDKVLQLPVIYTEQQRLIADQALDVLFYPDIGMSKTYFLAFARLAPVQLVSWGHPDTTGLDSIDYFVSTTGIEPEGAQEHYSERLICLNRLPCFYQPISVPDEILPRAALGLPEAGTLYGCPQSLFKLHPDFDAILAEIAAGDPDGHVVLIEGGENWVNRLKERWASSAPILNERVIFLPRQPLKQFMMLMAHFDVLLDPPHFGSGNTLYQAMVYGTPIVTWPGRFMRGRIVAGAYRQMGIADAPIAQTLNDYAPLALGLGRDTLRRQALRQACLDAAGERLFSDRAAVQEFERFIAAALEAAAMGEKLPFGWRPSAELIKDSANENDKESARMTETPRKLTLDQALQQGVEHHRAGQLQDAERLYRAILEVAPQHPDANHNLAVLAIGAGQPEAALPFFKMALEANPKVEQFWASYADGLLQARQVNDARQIILLARQHGHAGAALQQIEARLEQAAAPVPRPAALPADPLAPAIAAREAGHYRAAISWLDQWLVTHPADASAMALLAHVLLLDRQDARALAVLQQAQTLAPDLAAVQHNLARLALKKNQPIVALQAAQHALRTDPNNLESWLVQAAALSANQRDAEALPFIDRALQTRPGYAEAWANRALIRLRAKDKTSALADIEKALALKPHLPQLWQFAASLRHEAKNLPGAIEAMQKALEAEPGNVGYMVSLGEFFRQNYQNEAAIAVLDKAVSIAPDNPTAWTNLGAALHGDGHLEKARVAYETALRLKPDQAEVAHNLGVMAKDGESWDAALDYFDQALAHSPDHVQYLASKGQALLGLRRPPEEIEKVAQKIFAIEPDHEAGLRLLGAFSMQVGRLADAAAYFRKVVAITPNSAEANTALGEILKDIDELEEAESYLRRATELNPEKLKALEGLLFTYNYLAHHSSGYRLTEARRYGAIASRKVTERLPHHAPVTPPQRLRVGIVSGDLNNHPVGYFLESFLRHIDHARIELVAYPTQPKSDELTERLGSGFTAWTPLYGKSDALAARRIVDDGVHILLDLSGHTDNNRLSLFAWKPAPVQVSWLGYFATTGVEQMDYLLGDPYVTPPDEEEHFTERVWRMPESYLCFSPPAMDIEAAPLPALAAGYITFGCFNNLSKMNDAVVALWARVLLEVPTSRLLLKTKQLADEKQRQRTIERFAAQGIAADRLILEGPVPRAELLAAYHRVDIALDPFPYPGGTTSAEALWMGVPVLTKRGDCFLSHVGETIAHNAGLPSWIALDDADYVAKAVAFATDVAALARLRAGLRAQVLASPLFDAPRFARHFEEALWGMWQHWLDTQEERLQ